MLYSFLKNIKNLIVYCRFGRTFIPDTSNSIALFNLFMRLIHFKEHNVRKKIPIIKNDLKIENELGFKVINEKKIFSEKQLESLIKLKKHFNNINWNEDQSINRKKNFLLMKKIEIDNDLQKVVEGLLPIVSNYIGSLPVLHSANYWFSPNTNNEEGRSQSWHMDSEDSRQLKIFIPVEEICTNSGPINIMPADLSYTVYKKLYKEKIIKKRNVKISDNLIDQCLNEDNYSNPIKLKIDEIAFLDTCRCYHYGSRKSKKSRKLISLHFTSAYSLYAPIFRRNLNYSNYTQNNSDLVYGFRDNNFYSFRNVKLKKWEIRIL